MRSRLRCFSRERARIGGPFFCTLAAMKIAFALSLVLVLVLVAPSCGDSTASSVTEVATASTASTGASTGASAVTSTGTSAGESTGISSSGGDVGWVSSLEVGTDKGAFLSVWGPSSNEVYAVGGQLGAGGSTGMIFRYDGVSWSEEVLPPDTASLNWVSGAGKDIWAVGYEGAALRLEDGLWVSHPSGSASMLWGVFGAAENEVWAVGGDGVADDPVLLRFDGESWQVVELPTIDAASHGLFKVWGSAVDDVMVVGDHGVTIHYDGQDWSVVDSGSITDLISVWGPGGPAEMFAVGGRANGRLARWHGAEWTAETLSIPGLNGVWVDSSGVATIVGWGGTIYSVAAGGMDPVPEESGTPLLLHAVFGFDGGPRFAAGGSLQGSPPFVGLVLIDDGSQRAAG